MEPEIEPDASDARKSPAPPKPRAGPEKIESVPVNWARKAHTSDRMPVPDPTNIVLSEDRTRVTLDDQTSYAQNDFVFVEPAAAPPPSHRDDIDYAPPAAFRIARIMAFEGEPAALRVRLNWFYRPGDVAKHASNSRELLASFDTGLCALTDFRGKCQVANKMELRNLARYCERPSQFWFAQLFDPVTRRMFDIVPVPFLKSLNPAVSRVIAASAFSVVVPLGVARRLCEPLRKRKPPAQPEKDSPEPELSPEQLALRNEWPFRFLKVSSLTLGPAAGLPRLGAEDSHSRQDRHLDVPDWPGKPLVYYTMAAHNPASGQAQKLRLLETAPGQDLWSVDTSLPWVQQMPKGYIGRGSDATATEVSLPLPGIAEFVQACQTNYASQLGVEPHNLNFIDACCKVFTTNRGDENKALTEVSRFTRRTIGEPEFTATERDAFEAAMNPFLKKSWHDVFKAVETKPIADLSQYFWSRRPMSAVTPLDDEYWRADPGPEDEGIQCVICSTEQCSDWMHLPGYVPVPATGSNAKKALCSRCARLWFRYQVTWQPAAQVEALESEGHNVEAELVEDSKAMRAEEERRKKRRAAAQEKQEATARRKEEAKQARAEAKATKKSAGAPARKKAKRDSTEPEPVSDRDSSVTAHDAVKAPVPSGAVSTWDEDHPRNPPATSEVPVADAGGNVAGVAATRTDALASVASAADASADAPVDAASAQDSNASPEKQAENESEFETEVPVSRRRPQSTQLTLATIDDDFIDSLSEDVLPEAASLPQNCAVCGQVDASMAQQTCASCSVKVHAACYGPGRHKGPGPWLCDCCVNGRVGLGLDTFYQCAVCPSKQPTYVRWLNGEKVGPPDVLKGTVDKTWCHLRCAVWIRDITFLNPEELDGVDLGDVSLLDNDEQCAICTRSIAEKQMDIVSELTGLPTKGNTYAVAQTGMFAHCDICNETFHVSCAAEQGYAFGFLKSTSPPRPVIRCSRHGFNTVDLRPMSFTNVATDITMLQEYVQKCKRSQRQGTITAAERARRLGYEESRRLKRGIQLEDDLVVSKNEPTVVHQKARCSECNSRNAPYWLTTEKGVACPLCFRGLHWSGRKIVDVSAPQVHVGLLAVTEAIVRNGTTQN